MQCSVSSINPSPTDVFWPSEVVVRRCSAKKAFLKIFQNSKENTCARVSFLITLLKKRLRYRCFPVNFAKISRTTFFIEYLWWLLLDLIIAYVGWEWNYPHHIFFSIGNCYLLTWNLAHILSNLKTFKKAIKTFWIWRDIFNWSHYISAFSAGNLAFTCFC